MPLEQVYFVGQTIAAIAVIVSLIYVGRQVQQNTQATQVTAAQAYVQSYVGLLDTVVGSEQMGDVMHRGLTGLSNLKKGEEVQFITFMDQAHAVLQALHFQGSYGVLNDPLWATYRRAMTDLLGTPGVRQWWEIRRHWYDKEFQQYIDDLLSHDTQDPMFPSLGDD